MPLRDARVVGPLGGSKLRFAEDLSRFARALLASAATLASLAVGCGAAPSKQADVPAAYDWSDYKGTYAKVVDSAPAEPVVPGDAKAEAGDGAPKLSKGTIQGESVSSVTADTLADASKNALKARVVSSNVIVGREYEQVQVVMKAVSVQIIRPTATPDKAGPKLRSPKARSNSLSKSEFGWYDAEANVLVLVRAPRKASSRKALLALLQK